ncbi:glycosyltransferase family 4 protein [Camelliibacillus cellulosilyticus]|uniref:Glycosyltransferase family 4 protein n=1 Tax=Camelliibacillus cellulosilyticus TaxID=2174486 RepID=A0ABV9GP88_9BACL
MDQKILFCATWDIHFKKFHLPYFKWFKDQGWQVHVAASGDAFLPFVDERFHLPIKRSPFSKDNLRAFRILKAIIKDGDYRIVHCHTPMGGALTRLAARKVRKQTGVKVVYTAHGFHFYQGAPWVNWLVYYPIEKWLASYTDCLVTINQEDLYQAIHHRFRAARVGHVHGVGVDVGTFQPVNQDRKRQLRKACGNDPDAFLMFYAAEFNRNKNQQWLIRLMARIKETAPDIRLLLAGEGPLLKDCQALASKLDVADRIDFLGYQDDIRPFLQQCNLAVAASYREGLPVNILEAMATGLPVIASQNRGHRELIEDGVNGYLIPINDTEQFLPMLLQLYRSKSLCETMGLASLKRIDAFSVENIAAELKAIYQPYMSQELDFKLLRKA